MVPALTPQVIITTGALGYATYIAATCPCEVYLSCHLEHMVAALSIAAIVGLGPLFF